MQSDMRLRSVFDARVFDLRCKAQLHESFKDSIVTWPEQFEESKVCRKNRTSGPKS